MARIVRDDNLSLMAKIAVKHGVLFHASTCSTDAARHDGTEITSYNHRLIDGVPPVPPVPPIPRVRELENRKNGGGGVETTLDPIDQDYNYQERAAIREFDGGMTRCEAERLARLDCPTEA